MKNTIFIEGDIAPWNNRGSLSYLNDELKKCDGGDIKVYIKSMGGIVFEGIDMHNALRAYASQNNAKVTTVAMGIVASIALFIFLGGDERHAFDNSALMGHNSWRVTFGDRIQHKSALRHMEQIDDIQAKKFQKLQGLPLDTIKQNMTDEMWYMGEDSLIESKLVTKVLDTEGHITVDFPEGIEVNSDNDPVSSRKGFEKNLLAASLKHDYDIDFEKVENSIQECYGNCSITPTAKASEKVVENPSVNAKQVTNKGEDSNMDYKKQFEDLQAKHATSTATIEALNATVGDNEKAIADKESEIKALKEAHENEIKAHKKVFNTVLASGKHFELDNETLQANLDKAVGELTANANYTDGFVAHTVNTLVLASIETEGAVVSGENQYPQAKTNGQDYWDERNKKRNKEGAK